MRARRGRRQRGQQKGHETNERDEPAFVKHVSAPGSYSTQVLGIAQGWPSERDVGRLLVCGSHPAQLIERFREQLIEQFQPFDVLDDADDLEM